MSPTFTLNLKDFLKAAVLLIGTGIYLAIQDYMSNHELPDVYSLLEQMKMAYPTVGIYLAKQFVTNSTGNIAPEKGKK